MATFSSACTSTAAKAVAGCTGGGLWSAATAGSASQRQQRRDCPQISHRARLYHLRLDCGKARSVTHDSVFLQSGLAGGAGGGRAVVALAHGHHAKVSRGAAGTAGPWFAHDLARLGRERPVIWVHAVSVGEVLAVSRLVKTLDAALPDYFDRSSPPPRAPARRWPASASERSGSSIARWTCPGQCGLI